MQTRPEQHHPMGRTAFAFLQALIVGGILENGFPTRAEMALQILGDQVKVPGKAFRGMPSAGVLPFLGRFLHV